MHNPKYVKPPKKACSKNTMNDIPIDCSIITIGIILITPINKNGSASR